MVDFEYRALYGTPEEEAASADLVVSCIVSAQPNAGKEPQSFLDLFCGNGFFLQRINALMPQKIMDYADIRYLRQLARQQVFGDSFHLEGLITEISRILKPGGMYYVFDNLREPERTILKQANLQCVKEDYLWEKSR